MKKNLNELANSLQKSTTTSWSTGGLEQFSVWAKRMRDTINVVVPQLRVIAETSDLEQMVDKKLNERLSKLYTKEEIKRLIYLSREYVNMSDSDLIDLIK